jgi:Flp pilus assembly protein TadG
MEKLKLQHLLSMKERQGDDAGQAMVEFALTMPLLILLLLGAVELARVAFASIELSNAARAAAQYGAQNATTVGDPAGMATAASNEAANLAGVNTTVLISGICSSGAACTGANSGAGPTCKNTDCQTNANDHVETILTVTSTVSFQSVMQVSSLPSSFTLQRTVTQKCLNC